MEVLAVPATIENLERMIDFVVSAAKNLGFKSRDLNQIRLAGEEALVNVVNYAYPGREGTVEIRCAPAPQDGIIIEIVDAGIPFDPLAKAEPDLSLPMEQRQIGGLGISMIRKIMDKVAYRRDHDRNVLTLSKFK